MKSAMLIITFTTVFLLAACTNNGAGTKRAACNQLKSNLIFNGSTSNTRAAEIQESELPLTKRTYDQNC